MVAKQFCPPNPLAVSSFLTFLCQPRIRMNFLFIIFVVERIQESGMEWISLIEYTCYLSKRSNLDGLCNRP